MRLAIIVNPISGTGGRSRIARRRVGMAAAFIDAHGLDGEVCVTEHAGHGRALTRGALARGANLVVAWGGDGTMNEVGSELAFSSTVMAIIPSGSGNGLARDLRIPTTPEAAFANALHGVDRRIDAGEIDGHLFFNIAGIGLDAHVAHRFAADGQVRRGLRRYVQMTLRELFAHEPGDYTITTDAGAIRERVLMIAIANGRQYGNGAVIAPDARLDDGRLDVVVIAHRPAVQVLWQIPKLFAGRVTEVRGVHVQQARQIEIASNGPVLFHADGEPFAGGASIVCRSHAAALTVRVPRSREPPRP